MNDLIMFVAGVKGCIEGEVCNSEDINYLQGYATQYEFEQMLTSKSGEQDAR